MCSEIWLSFYHTSRLTILLSVLWFNSTFTVIFAIYRFATLMPASQSSIVAGLAALLGRQLMPLVASSRPPRLAILLVRLGIATGRLFPR